MAKFASATLRQAYALAVELDSWADGEIAEWLHDPSGPLHEVAPFVISIFAS